MLGGIELVESKYLAREVSEVGRYSFKRPFWRRLLSGKLHDIITETVHIQRAYEMGDNVLVVSPETMGQLKKMERIQW